MRKFIVLAIAAAAALLTALPAVAAPTASHDVLTIGKVGGTNVKKNAILSAGLARGKKATFLIPGGTGITCREVTFTDKITSNPRAGGVANEKLTKQTFKRCSTNIADSTGVKSVTLSGLPYKSTINGRTDQVIVKGTTATLAINTTLGTLTCVYHAASTKGTASNASQTITFTNQPFSLRSGPSACPGSGHFTADFGPVKDTSVHGDPHVFVNK